jgi:hypothetical protein
MSYIVIVTSFQTIYSINYGLLDLKYEAYISRNNERLDGTWNSGISKTMKHQ